MNHVMIDVETLGTEADAVMLSIGAVMFDLDSDEINTHGFYAVLGIDDQLNLGRRIDEATLRWWFQQSKEAQAVFEEKPKQHLADVLHSMTSWFGHTKRIVWSNGASFDIPMIAHAYSMCSLSTPWEFWNSRCVRTYRSLPGAGRVAKIEPSIAHHALHDAVAQAKTVQAIQKVLKK